MKHLLLLAGAAALATGASAYAKPGHGNGNRSAYGNGANCPPGLAKKNNGCMAPGQYKKRFARGQRFNSTYGQRYAYNQLPYDIRRQYDLDRSNRYYYDQGYLYQVDPRTMLVERVIQTILGRR
jgi:hypothetical protein